MKIKVLLLVWFVIKIIGKFKFFIGSMLLYLEKPRIHIYILFFVTECFFFLNCVKILIETSFIFIYQQLVKCFS